MARHLSDIPAVRAQSRPRSEGRCIPRLQVYRMSAQTDRLLVWRLIRRDAPGLNATQHVGGSKTSLGPSTRQGAAAVHAFGSTSRCPLHSPRTDSTNAAPLRYGVLARHPLLRRLR